MSVYFKFVGDSGTKVMKASTSLQADELIDCSRMNVNALRAYLAREIAECKVSQCSVSLDC